MRLGVIAAAVVVLASSALAASTPRATMIVQPVPVTVWCEPPKPEPKLAWSDDPVWITAIATILLTVATAFLWVFTGLMWWEARSSRRDTEEALKLAHAANEIAERSIVEQNRPWVFVKELRFEPEKPWITVVFTNAGATPARRFTKAVSAMVLPLPFPSAPLPEPDEGYSSFLAPGAVELLTLEKPSRPMKNGYEYRIRIAISYEMQAGKLDTLYEDYACDGDGRIRKVTPRDFAAFQGVDTYTVGESQSISD